MNAEQAGTAAAEPSVADAWHELTELWTVRELVAYAQQQGDYCCQLGCGGGGCESCPCCCAGYCVSGLDGVPTPGSDVNPLYGDPAHAAESFRNWLEVAAKHNPVADSLLGGLTELATAVAGAKAAVQSHDLVVSLGDCELGGECTCGTPLGVIRVDQSLDELGRAWERHVMTEVPR